MSGCKFTILRQLLTKQYEQKMLNQENENGRKQKDNYRKNGNL